MRILADKYHIKELPSLALIKLLGGLYRVIEPDQDMVEAIKTAYSVDRPTSMARLMLVRTVVKPDFSAESLSLVLAAHPQFACDVAMALRKEITRSGEERK